MSPFCCAFPPRYLVCIHSVCCPVSLVSPSACSHPCCLYDSSPAFLCVSFGFPLLSVPSFFQVFSFLVLGSCYVYAFPSSPQFRSVFSVPPVCSLVQLSIKACFLLHLHLPALGSSVSFLPHRLPIRRDNSTLVVN